MNQLERFRETIATYHKHGWRLERVLMSEETRAQLAQDADASFENVAPQLAPVDALWFARVSHEGREAWELRLVAASPYALFETFEADESEEDREDVRREMEARLRDYTGRGPSN
jgi:hypothetical protein